MNILTFDIGGTSIKYGIITRDGDIIEKDSFPTPLDNKEEFYGKIKTIFDRYKDRVEGVALSSPGVVDSKEGLIKLIYAIPFLQGVNVKKDLETLLGTKVTIENDGKCAALAEVWQGSGNNYNDIAFIVIGTGIGGAIVKNKEIHHGNNLACGELGMMLLPNKNGGYHSWSKLASTINLVHQVEDRLSLERGSLDGERVFLMEEEGDEVCREEIDNFYRNIALGIYNLQFSFDPESVIIGGGISKRADLCQKIKEKLNELNNEFGSLGDKLDILPCKFSNDANMLGAVYHYLEEK